MNRMIEILRDLIGLDEQDKKDFRDLIGLDEQDKKD